MLTKYIRILKVENNNMNNFQKEFKIQNKKNNNS